MKKKTGAVRTKKAHKSRLSAVSAPLPPKLTAPHPASIFPRKRLFHLLDRIRQEHPVIWISAPAGSGKTSLAASYLQERRLPVLWYQVDSGDGDIASFFYYMGIAAKRAAPRYKKALPVLTPEYLGDVPTFTRNFFRELFSRLKREEGKGGKGEAGNLKTPHRRFTHSPFLVVLDNYQDAPEDSKLHDIMQIAMAEVPEGTSLIVLSRNEPPSVLARLRLCEHAACLDWEKIRLTAEETEGISALRTGKTVLDHKTLNTMHDRTHGWAAGVVLMLEQSKSGAPLGAELPTTNQKLLFDYFAGEILNRCEPKVQEFLLKTALFPKITAKAAEALTGIAKSQAILDDLTRRNYFTVRHASRNEDSYEYHPLFRDFLLAHARQQLTDAQLIQTQRRAAEILEGVGQFEDAIVLYRLLEDWASMVRIILANSQRMIAQGRNHALEQWANYLPQAVINDDAWLQYWLGHAIFPFIPVEGRGFFKRAFNLFKKAEDRRGIFLTAAVVIDTIYMELDDMNLLIPWIVEIEKILEEDPTYPDPEIETRIAYSMFTAMFWGTDNVQAMHHWEKRLEDIVLRNTDINFQIMAIFTLATFRLWMGNFESADRVIHLLEGLVKRREAMPLVEHIAIGTEAEYGWMSGNPEMAIKKAKEGNTLVMETGVRLWFPMLLGHGAAAALSLNDLKTAREFLDQLEVLIAGAQPIGRVNEGWYYFLSIWYDLLKDDLPTAWHHLQIAMKAIENAIPPWAEALLYFATGEVLRVEEKPQEALVFFAQMHKEARHFDSHLYEASALFSEAMIALDIWDEPNGLNLLHKAFTFANSKKLLNIMYWRPSLMSRLCAKALEHNIEIDYAQMLIKKRNLLPQADKPTPDLWPFPVKLYTLGRFSLLVDGKPIKFSGKGQKKPIELLKALIALGGRDVLEGQITDLLWPDAEGDTGHSAFTTTMQRLRKLLCNEDAILIKEGKITLNPQYCYVDAWAFERLISKADEMWKEDKETEALKLTEKAVLLYKGRFLGKEGEEQYMLSMQERLRGKFIRTLAKIGGYLEKRGEWKKAVESYQKGIEIDNLCEEFYQSLMLCYQHLGLKAEAITAYNSCCKAMSALLNTEPSEKTKEIYQRIMN